MSRALFLAIALSIAAPLAAQEEQPRKPKETPGSATQRARTPPMQTSPIEGETWIGMRAHDFELDGSRGQPVKLSNLRGQWIVLLFANRKEDLKKLKSIDAEMRSLGAQLVGVVHEKSHGVNQFAKRDSIPFLLLADPTGQVCWIYGLFDHQYDEATPAMLLLDPQGYVRMALLGRIPPAEQTAGLARFGITDL